MAKSSVDDNTEASANNAELQSQQAKDGSSTEGLAPQNETEGAAPEELVEQSPNETASLVREQYGIPDTWSAEQVNQWFVKVADLPEGTEVSKDGVFFNDPTRDKRPYDTWSSEELLMALKGDLEISDNKLSGVIKEYRKRSEEIEDAWSFRQVLDFYREGVIPEKTASGVWVLDVTRNERQPSSWSTQELEAWAKGEIKATSRAPDNKLAVELKNRLKLNSKSNNPADVIAAYKGATQRAEQSPETPQTSAVKATQPSASSPASQETVKGLTHMNLSYIDSTLERYADAVKPGKPVSEQIGASETTKLENMFQYVIKLEPEGMVAGLERIKAFVTKHREGLFSPSNAHRFDHMLRKEGDFKERHINFVELLMIYTDPNKDVRQQCDIRYLLAKQPEDRQDMLVEYFTKVA